MTSHYYTSYCTSRLPYVGRISAGENDDVDFIYQFVKHTKHVFHEKSLESHYLSGTPTKFPNYGDFPRTFSMKNYGFDISISSWQNKADIDIPQPYKSKMIFVDYIDIVFYEAVYPIRVSIYEIYNPGNIIKIWAQDSDGQWYVLWKGTPQIVPQTSRLFSPPLQSCDFKTKSLRLKFKYNKWSYYTKLDAVMLIGTSELIVPKNRVESLTNLLKEINCMYNFQYENEDVHNLTTDYKNAHLDIVHLQENFLEYCSFRKSNLEKSSSKRNLNREKVSRKVIPDYVQHFRQRYLHFRSKCDLNSAKRMKLSSDESMELPCCSFSSLPDEIILKVLKNLDLRALCRMSQVNKRFNNLTRDCQLYKCLNVRCIKASSDMYNIFDYFTPRCKYLQQLDLTASEFSCEDLEKFLSNCGKDLTHLRIYRCFCINNTVLLQISKICKKLKKLDVRRCGSINDRGFSYLENLELLECLSIDYICPKDRKETQTQILCKILHKNQQMRELHLEMVIDIERVAIELKNSCRNLELINLNNPYKSFKLQGINALADCKGLRKIILYTKKIEYVNERLERLHLFSSCQNLEEVYLSCDLRNHDLNSLKQCKNLKKLYLYDMKFVTFDTYSDIFEQCFKLQELYLINCEIKKRFLNQWTKRYPHVSIFVKNKNYLRNQREGEYIDVDI